MTLKAVFGVIALPHGRLAPHSITTIQQGDLIQGL